MNYFPFFHRLDNRRALMVGGGKVATRRGLALLRCGLILDVVAPSITAALSEAVAANGGKLHHAAFDDSLLKDEYELVFVCTDQRDVNAAVAEAAKLRKIAVNVVDDKNACDFIFPALVDRDPLVIAIANQGRSPVLSRLLSQQLEAFIPKAYGRLSDLVGDYRLQVQQQIPKRSERIAFWEEALQGAVAEALFSGKEKEARALLAEQLKYYHAGKRSGEVYLIGAGPGDPDLLTLRAFRLLQQADVVVYDRLVSSDVMELVAPGVEKIYVGKQRSEHSMAQPGINALLVKLAKEGKRVARLKGGDPFVFGRGGEEIEALAEDGLAFQVVPGITAANGCSCYAGIPLTHRDYAQSVQFLPGQLKSGDVDLDWPNLAQADKTLVFYMGLASLPLICQHLIAHNLPADTSVAVVEKGTLRHQRLIKGELANIAEKVKETGVQSPALLIVGKVVLLADKLSWYNQE